MPRDHTGVSRSTSPVAPMSRPRSATLVEATPPQLFFVGSAIFHYLGPSFAVLLFARVDLLGVAWLRIASAGVIFAVGARSAPNLVALGLAVAGVYALVDVRLEGEPVGVAFAFANAFLFAAYIVLAHRLARAAALARIDGLAAAMLVALVVVTPIGGWSAARALLDPVALAAGVGVGVASSVVPYVFDQLAMARLSRAGYSLMVALLPATATVIGVIVLAQVPTRFEVLGVALVVVAVALHREPGASA
jgi:inner membrane transporter RhtA